jgi:hypothetical protein
MGNQPLNKMSLFALSCDCLVQGRRSYLIKVFRESDSSGKKLSRFLDLLEAIAEQTLI